MKPRLKFHMFSGDISKREKIDQLIESNTSQGKVFRRVRMTSGRVRAHSKKLLYRELDDLGDDLRQLGDDLRHMFDDKLK